MHLTHMLFSHPRESDNRPTSRGPKCSSNPSHCPFTVEHDQLKLHLTQVEPPLCEKVFTVYSLDQFVYTHYLEGTPRYEWETNYSASGQHRPCWTAIGRQMPLFCLVALCTAIHYCCSFEPISTISKHQCFSCCSSLAGGAGWLCFPYCC